MEKLANAGEDIAERLSFERLIAELAMRLAQVEPEQLDDEINRLLQSIGCFLATERAFMAMFSDGGKSLMHTNIWAAEGIDVNPRLYQLNIVEEIPWLAREIREGRMVNAGSGLTGLPAEAKRLRSYLQGVGVNSGIVVPICVQGGSVGLLGLDTILKPRDYPPAIVDRLKI